jgi:replicative DNA helicase
MSSGIKTRTIVPPHSIESEQACLGAILIDPGYALNEVMDLLTSDDFYKSSHQIIFKMMVLLNRENQPIDTITLSEKLKEEKVLDQCGGVSYIASLTTAVPTSGNVKYYGRMIKDKSQLRDLMQISSQIYEMATNEQDDVQDIVDYAEKLIFSIAETRKKGKLINIKDILSRTIEMIESRVKNKGVYTGVPTGFKDLDDMTYGFQRSDLIILAARPSMGKTALALNIATNIAVREKKSVLFFSLEMSAEQLVQRVLSAEARVDSTRLRSGYLENKDWQKLLTGVDKLSHSKIWIEDTPGLSYTDMRAIARRLKAKEGVDFIVVDYLQLISIPFGQKQENRQSTVAEISRNLKLLARELDVPVMTLSQLSREVEKRSDKEPVLSDLRESGAIEQDADIVAFIHRPGYYDRENEAIKNLAEIIIAKQRNGPVGKVKLTFIDQHTRFEDYYDESRIS